MITPRVAIIDNATQAKNIVLMGAVSQNICDILYLQMVRTPPLLYAEKVLGCNHDGLLSVSKMNANKTPVFSDIVGNFTVPLETTTASGTKHQLNLWTILTMIIVSENQ
jgi:hypothetical protein